MNHAIYVIDGRRYRWSGWFGCQLESMEWRRVPAGTERTILGKTFRVFRTESRRLRDRLRVATSWYWIDTRRGDLNQQGAAVEALRKELRQLP